MHPKTGKICVPIDPKRPDAFKVSEVPTLTQCINEIGAKSNQVKHEDGDSLTPQCLEPFMATFRSFLKGCDKDRMLNQQAANKEKAQNGSGGMDF